jgi:hypothetical protein
MQKHLLIGALAIAMAGAGAARLMAREGDAKAASIMAETRKALGGEKKLGALKALSMRAEFRREMTAGVPGGAFIMMRGPGGAADGGQISGSLEIDFVVPDKFYRMESTASGLGLIRVDGFEGDRPFLEVSSSNPGARVMADSPTADPERAKAVLKRTHAELARLLLGAIGSTQPGLPVTYTYAGQAEAPDGTAHIIDVNGPDGFKARLFIDTGTHLPLMLTYSELEPRPMRMVTSHGAPPAGGTPRVRADGASGRLADLTPEQRAEIEKQMQEAEETPRKTIEYRMFFSDYRDVDGISLPHRLGRGTAEKTTEEWDIKSYKVNPTIKDERFKVGTE